MTASPALYDVSVRHVRTAPIRHEVQTRMHLWLVDVDALPTICGPLRFLSSFRAADHVGDPRRSVRENIEAVLAEHGIDVAGGRILMLTSPRVLGYVFNPLSLFWCHRPNGSLAGVVAEVHNTYGGRHAYVLRPDGRGRTVATKEFYVSPFFPVDGYYEMSLPEPGDRLNVVVTLHLPDGPPFVTTMHGARRPVKTTGFLRHSLQHPLASRSTMAKIRRHGIALWLRRVPVVARPVDVRGRSTSCHVQSPVGSAPRR